LRGQVTINGSDQEVVAVQRLDPRKKVEVLLRAAKIVIETLPATKFIIIGDGPERQRLESMNKQLGLDSHVAFTLNISDGDLINYLSVADVFSIHTAHEGFGIFYIEAMSMGLPIVTSRANGNEGLIGNGKKWVYGATK
jgi:glycosyltransferase involved in cell wall biosynthesis